MNKDQYKIAFPILIFLISFTIFLKCLCPTIYVGDSGELVAAASSLGIPHNPGYPLYSLIGKIFSFLPFGSQSFCLNLMSAFFGAGSTLVVYFILITMFSNLPVSALLALIYGSVSTLWNVSVSSEVYSLYAFFAGILLLVTLKFRKIEDIRYFFLFLFLFSLALANHIAIIMVIPPLLILIFNAFYKKFKRQKIYVGKLLVAAFILTILGLSVYLYLPVRSNKNPTINWSDTKNFKNLIYHTTFKEHRSVALSHFSFSRTLERTEQLVNFLLNQFPVPISILYLVFGLCGIIYLFRDPFLLITLLVIIFLNVFYILFLNQVPLSVTGFGFPSYLVTTLLVCAGILNLTGFLLKRNPDTAITTIIVFALIALYPIGLIFNYHKNNRNENRCAYQFIKNLLLTPTRNSVLFVDGDNQTFLSMYLRNIEGFRRDIDLYTYTFSACHQLDGFTGFIYKNKNGAFPPREIEKRFPGNDIYYSADPMNLKHTKFPLMISGTLYRAIKKSDSMTLDKDIWLDQLDDCFLNRNIYKDILTRELTSKYYLRKGDFEFINGNIEKSREYLNNAILEGNDIYFILYEIGLHYIKMGYKNDASRLMKQAIKLKKEFIEAYLSLSDILRSQNHYPRAIEVLNKAYSMKPKDSLICGKIGELLNEMCEYEKAIVFLNKAIKYKPEDPINYYNIGNSHLGLGDYKSAAMNYNIAISMGIKEPEVFNNLGNALKASGDYYGALAKYKYALNINPEYVPALNNLGLVLTKLKKYDQAAILYQKALDLDPGYAGIYCNLGTLYHDYLDEPEKAVYYWSKYITLAPDTQQAGVIASRLDMIRMKKEQ